MPLHTNESIDSNIEIAAKQNYIWMIRIVCVTNFQKKKTGMVGGVHFVKGII